jgi:hypothetical protein
MQLSLGPAAAAASVSTHWRILVLQVFSKDRVRPSVSSPKNLASSIWLMQPIIASRSGQRSS